MSRSSRRISSSSSSSSSSSNPALRPAHQQMPMKNIHRAMLQFLLARGAATEKECSQYFTTLVSQGYEQKAQLSDVLATINDSLSFMKLEVRREVFEADGERYMALVNMTNDESARSGLKYLSDREILLFQQIFDFMLKHNGAIRLQTIHATADKLPRDKKLTHAQTEQAIVTFIQQGWLKVVNTQKAVLGVRAYAEFRDYLEAKMNEGWTVACHVCKRPCYQGIKCGNGSCDVKMHKHCAAQRFHGVNEKKCPRADCGHIWN